MSKYRVFDDYTGHFWAGDFNTIDEAYKRVEDVLLNVFCEFESKVLSQNILSHILLRQRALRVVDITENSCNYGYSG